jgi:hypothetical protein
MEKNNNKLLWIAIALTFVMFVVGFSTKFLVEKIADQVIIKLQKEYSPSPNGPGIDPDKLDPEKLIRSSESQSDWNRWENMRN